MNPIITSALYWRGFIAKLVISSIVILALAISSALSAVNNWSDLTTTQQVIIICGIVGVAGTNINSLLDKTFAQKSAAQDDPNNPSAPSPLATKAENLVDSSLNPPKV
jgi:hypothetical protein